MSVFGFSDLAFMAVAAGYTPTDANAAAYITAVETADGQALEPGVRRAIDEFVIGCKADGIWNAIKASCIMAGARTLNGALVPLVGAAPTNFNFVAGDYNRKTGLVGDGSTKYLNANRNTNVEPQNNRHAAVYMSTGVSRNSIHIGTSAAATPGTTQIASDFVNGTANFSLSNTSVGPILSLANALGFRGASRSAGASFTARINSGNVSFDIASNTPINSPTYIYCRDGNAVFSNARLAFYSIGESLNLALLDARVTALMYGIQKTLLEGDFDIDAAAYISRVETADGQDLEPAVRTAINDFVVGCKADGIWSAIKASCILAGARTLNGALVPLVGVAPTNVGPFVAGDYNRKIGITKSAGAKAINTNRANNADPQNSHHIALYMHTVPSGNVYLLFSGTYTTIERLGNDYFTRNRNSSANGFLANTVSAGLLGMSRSTSGAYTRRVSGANTLVTQTSSSPDSTSQTVFATFDSSSNARVAFYSIGESLNLALLDARVTTLINAFAAAIP